MCLMCTRAWPQADGVEARWSQTRSAVQLCVVLAEGVRGRDIKLEVLRKRMKLSIQVRGQRCARIPFPNAPKHTPAPSRPLSGLYEARRMWWGYVPRQAGRLRATCLLAGMPTQSASTSAGSATEVAASEGWVGGRPLCFIQSMRERLSRMRPPHCTGAEQMHLHARYDWRRQAGSAVSHSTAQHAVATVWAHARSTAAMRVPAMHGCMHAWLAWRARAGRGGGGGRLRARGGGRPRRLLL